MESLYQEGTFMQALEALIQKKVEEALNNFVELRGEKISPQPCHKTQLPDIEYLTRKETAALLKISLVTLHNWTTQGRLTAYRIGTRVRYKADEVNNALIEIKTTKYKRE
ncbi:MAG: hypothetical protein RL662_2244 [Bacteroidota bacterium]|jgi:excisionase family DNA binding protein